MDDATRGRLRGLVAQAIWVADEGPRRADEWWDAGEHEAVRAAYFKRADAVLDALGVEEVMASVLGVPVVFRLRGIEEGGPCEICDGSGVWARYQGEGEMDELPCDACDGTGRGRG